MRLSTIKSRKGNEFYTKSIEKTIELIKSADNSAGNGQFYYLGYFNHRQFFLQGNNVYVLSVQYDYDEDRNPIIESLNLSKLYKINLKRAGVNGANENNIEVSTLLQFNATHNKLPHIFTPEFTPEFTPDMFITWLNEPSEINEEVDFPYFDVIKFLKHYTKETFRTGRYLFYPKQDGDSSFITNIYAYDIKNDVEVKLYILDEWKEVEGKWEIQTPQNLKDIVVDSSGNCVSDYKKREIKKAFIGFANQENNDYRIKNYWLMDMVKLTVQPVDDLHEWACHRCFSKPQLFGHIWVYDFPDKDESSSFFITDSPYLWETTKVATINFKSPTYAMGKIFKRGNVKRMSWKLNEQEIKDLTEFFNKPSERAEDYGSGQLYEGYKKYVKTNWQQLIFEYNHNTAGWGWGKKGFDKPPCNKPNDIEQLSFDLPLPDYTELLDTEND